MQPGDVVKLNTPEPSGIVGQGPQPAGLNWNGIVLEYGSIYKVSNKVKGLVNLQAPEPLIHIDLAVEIADQLTIISTK